VGSPARHRPDDSPSPAPAGRFPSPAPAGRFPSPALPGRFLSGHRTDGRDQPGFWTAGEDDEFSIEEEYRTPDEVVGYSYGVGRPNDVLPQLIEHGLALEGNAPLVQQGVEAAGVTATTSVWSWSNCDCRSSLTAPWCHDVRHGAEVVGVVRRHT
jgi:hypothetical protein